MEVARGLGGLVGLGDAPQKGDLAGLAHPIEQAALQAAQGVRV